MISQSIALARTTGQRTSIFSCSSTQRGQYRLSMRIASTLNVFACFFSWVSCIIHAIVYLYSSNSENLRRGWIEAMQHPAMPHFVISFQVSCSWSDLPTLHHRLHLEVLVSPSVAPSTTHRTTTGYSQSPANWRCNSSEP